MRRFAEMRPSGVFRAGRVNLCTVGRIVPPGLSEFGPSTDRGAPDHVPILGRRMTSAKKRTPKPFCSWFLSRIRVRVSFHTGTNMLKTPARRLQAFTCFLIAGALQCGGVPDPEIALSSDSLAVRSALFVVGNTTLNAGDSAVRQRL